MGIFGKKDETNSTEESKRAALFGSRSKSSKSSSQNPYANIPTQADAYNQAKARAGVPGYAAPASSSRNGSASTPPGGAPPGYMNNGSSRYPDEKKSGGYGNDRYGTQSGYGGDRYGGVGAEGGGGGGASRYGAGGYGGLGPAPSQTAPDENRAALFGGAKARIERQDAAQMGYGHPPPYDEQAPRAETDYQAYGDRQLTAEEEEEEDVQATKQQMKHIKQQDVSSTRNALRLAAQAEEQGMNTLARIGAQGERIHNTEKNLDLTANHNRMAEEKARELKHLNRSMFAVSVSNPFTAKSRAEQRDMDVLEKHALERVQREQSRRETFETNARMNKTFKDMSKDGGPQGDGPKKGNLAERAKYQFEADSEDDEMENELDSNLDALHGAAGRLNNLARATGKEVDEQNRHLERINAKSTAVDDQIALNRARLDRFH